MFDTRRTTLLTLACGATVVFASGSSYAATEVENANRIRPYAKNPYYWQYKGEPVLLLGGSKDDNLFQIPNLKEHLDLLASVGGNYIRNTMSDRKDKGFEVYPFKRLPDGKYDLNRWNDEYWKRFQNLLRWTGQRDIIVQIEVWDRFDYTDHESFNTWKSNPYNPENNINYTAAESGLLVKYPKDHPSRDKQPFFHTIPKMDDNIVLRKYQEAFVDKMLSHSLRYGNVLYCMNNETSTPPIWGQYWMKYIEGRATEAGVDVYVTDMFDVGWELETEEKFLLSFDRPDIYTFLDISQNNSNKNTFEKHWQNILFVRDRIKKKPRPINNTKNYGNSKWPAKSGYHKRVWRRWTTESAVQRYVLNVIYGCASTRFHRNPIGGIGLTKPAQNCIKALRRLESLVKMWELAPRNDLLTDYEDSKVFLSANPGQTYALFFLEGGSASLDLKGHEGTFLVKWINVATGEWGKEDEIETNAIVPITSPGEGLWLAVVIRKQQQTSWSGRGVLGIDANVSSQKTSGSLLYQVPDTTNDHGRVPSEPKSTIVNIATIGPRPLVIPPDTEAEKAVDRMITAAPEKTVVTNPESTDAVIFNPGMGLAFCHFSCPKDWVYGKPMWTDEISNHVYIRVLWKTVHPAPGEFSIDESQLGQYIAALKKTGKRFSFRIMPTCGSTPERDIAPAWIFDVKGVKFVPYTPAEQRFPVVWQKEYLEVVEEIVAELARRYDGDPQLEFVDVPIGSYGELWFFGDEAEWRKHGFSADRAISATKEMIDLYRRHFKHTRLALPIGGGSFEWPGWGSEGSRQRRVYNQTIQYCRRVGVMVRCDGFRVQAEDLKERFPPLAPVISTVGEPIASFLGPESDLSPQMTPSVEVYESALAAKLSCFCWYGALSEVTGAERDLIADFARKLGYRFTVAQVEHPSTLKTGKLRRGILSAEVTWRNDGVAFCHQEIQLRSALLDSNGKVLVEKRQWPIHPIQTWTPDGPVVEPIELKVPEGFAGKATLAVGMVTRAGRPINLALKENLPNHLYSIATVEVRKSDYAGDPIIFSQSNTPADWSVTGNVKATVVPRGGPTEKPFLRIGGPSLNDAWVLAGGKRMPALPGAKYRFTGSIRVESLTTGQTPYLKFAFLDAKTKQIDLATAGRSRWRRVSGNRFPAKGLPWEEFDVTAIAPPGTAYAQVAVEKGAPQPAEAVVGLQGLRVELLEAP